MPLLIDSQHTPEWRDAHVGRITASIAAGCLGLDPHCSRQKAWRTVLGYQRVYSNVYTDWGHRKEPVAREAYEVETGLLVVQTGLWVHPEYDWLGASPDGLVGQQGALELKCPGVVPARIPLPHRIQMLVALAVTGREWCDYGVWANGDLFIRRVYRSGLEGLIRKLAAFREEFVLAGVEPPRKQRKPKRKKK